MAVFKTLPTLLCETSDTLASSLIPTMPLKNLSVFVIENSSVNSLSKKPPVDLSNDLNR